MYPNIYLWAKVLHIVAVISWMAGILYLYRLLIYHRERGVASSDIHELLGLMEYRLYRYIAIPAMAVAAGAGLTMIALNPAMLSSIWLKAKILLVIALMWSTVKAGQLARSARVNASSLPSGTLLRFANELPTLLMIGIVTLVVFKWI